MQNFDAIIFDLGGVFTLPQRSDKLGELMALLGTELDTQTFKNAYSRHRLPYDRGTIDMDEYWRRVAVETGAKNGARPDGEGWSSLLPRLVRTDIEAWFDIRPGMLDLATRLRSEFGRLALLSNINRECATHVQSNYGWVDLFDVAIYSCDHGLLKPERAIFDLCLGRLGLSADRCIFVDDIEENVAGARSAGLTGIRFVDESDFMRDLSALTGIAF
jgi:putative hydrolase of the HAD superfamily